MENYSFCRARARELCRTAGVGAAWYLLRYEWLPLLLVVFTMIHVKAAGVGAATYIWGYGNRAECGLRCFDGIVADRQR